MKYAEARDLYAIGIFLFLKGLIILPIAAAGLPLIALGARGLSAHYNNPGIYNGANAAALAAAVGFTIYAIYLYAIGVVHSPVEYLRPLKLASTNLETNFALWPVAMAFAYFIYRSLKSLYQATAKKSLNTAAKITLAGGLLPITTVGIFIIYAGLFLALLATFNLTPPKRSLPNLT